MTSNRSGTPVTAVAVVRESLFPPVREPLSASSQAWGILPTQRFWQNWEHRWLALPLTLPMMAAFVLVLLAIPGMLQMPAVTAVLCMAWGHLSYGIVERRMRRLAERREADRARLPAIEAREIDEADEAEPRRLAS